MTYEQVELREDDDGVKRWFISTRDGWELVGDGSTLTLLAEHFKAGTKIELEEPVEH
jgi:hypothetical protein